MHGKCGIPSIAMLVGGFVFAHSQTVPNTVDISTYSITGQDPQIVRNFKDGLGRKLATFTKEGDGDIISGVKYDGYGRPSLEVKPYFTTTYLHDWPSLPLDVIGDADAYYNGSTPDRPNAQNYAYKETQLSVDPLGRTLGEGQPGLAFSLAGAHSKVWYLGVATPTFLTTSNLTEDNLNTYPAGDYAYFLEVTKDPNGNYRQTLKDKFEHVIKTWTDPKTAGSTDKIVDQKDYDYLGNMVRSFTPGNGSIPDPSMFSSFTFSTDGKIVSESHPDEGRKNTYYDRAGRVRFMQDARQLAETGTNTELTFIQYDAIGREILTGVVTIFTIDLANFLSQANLDNPSFPGPGTHPAGSYSVTPKIRKVYDDATNLAQVLELPPEADTHYLHNLRGRLAGVVAYGENPGTPDNRVAEVYSYREDGLVESKAVCVPGMPTENIVYQYDLQGRLVNKYTVHYRFQATPLSNSWDYFYDTNGRLTGIMLNGDWVTFYTYNSMGKLVLKEYLKNDNSIGQQHYTYNIRDWLSQTLATRQNDPLFVEDLNYETVGAAPQSNGNISRARFRYFLPGNQPDNTLDYSYDGADRMVAINNLGAEGEVFTYDVKGRIVTSKRADPSPLNGPFVYTGNTNQVVRVPGNPTRNNTNGNFVYDPKGNMVFDRSKKMAVTYNWANLPVLFQFYSSVPDRAITWQEVGSLGAVRASTEVLYDASGKRVLKKTNRYD